MCIRDSYSTTDSYPSVDEGLAILAEETDEFPDGLLNKVPVDPWKNPYLYRVPGTNAPFEVICLGSDAQEGGEGSEKDISSEDLSS